MAQSAFPAQRARAGVLMQSLICAYRTSTCALCRIGADASRPCSAKLFPCLKGWFSLLPSLGNLDAKCQVNRRESWLRTAREGRKSRIFPAKSLLPRKRRCRDGFARDWPLRHLASVCAAVMRLAVFYIQLSIQVASDSDGRGDHVWPPITGSSGFPPTAKR